MIRRLVFALRSKLRGCFLRLFEAALQQQLAPFNEISRQQQLERERVDNAINDIRTGRIELSDRISKLELLFTEHPEVVMGELGTIHLSSPIVSVIMPTWNRAGIVGDAIRSVQAQYFADWELIVIDDGSSDETENVLASFAGDARIRYVKRSHAGPCIARNYGLSIARGSLVAYLDSDNLWYPGFLAAAVRVFVSRPDVDCAYGALISDVHKVRILFEPFDRERLLAANFIDMSTFIHRRSLIERFGDFDAKTSGVEDWDLVLRYTVHAPAYRIPVAAARYRVMDGLRVTDVLDAESPATIRRKWGSGL
jgi:Glycosyl transferase family 2